MEGDIGQFESMVISRFLGRLPNDSTILGDNNGSPECRRVVFAALSKKGRRFAVGGKYSEAIVARIIAETQVVGDEGKTERWVENCEKKKTGLNTPKNKMNPVLEHSVS